MKPVLLLSYDLEEFDMPMEYGGILPFEEQVAISTTGLQRLLHLLDKWGVKATFYCTAQYALALPEVVKKLQADGHEVASHAYYHSQFSNEDLERSKAVLENIIQQPIRGFRMPRMMPVNIHELRQAGYLYNSSLHPTWLPGRYNHFSASRTWHYEEGLLQLPASVTPNLRIPLFWLAFHNYPLWYYWHCCQRTLRNDQYLNLYFHPWEFVDYKNAGGATFPGYVTRNCGSAMVHRTNRLLAYASRNKYVFETTYHWLQNNVL
jgi:hypothetical protein